MFPNRRKAFQCFHKNLVTVKSYQHQSENGALNLIFVESCLLDIEIPQLPITSVRQLLQMTAISCGMRLAPDLSSE